MKKNKAPMIGLTGLPCSGKSAAASILKKLGAHVIDVDRTGHAALEEPKVKETLTERFGVTILLADGTIDRTRLGDLVFEDREALTDLEKTVHPRMVESVLKEAQEQTKPVVLDAALLLPMGLDRHCTTLLVIQASETQRNIWISNKDWSPKTLQERSQRIQEGLNTIKNTSAVCTITNSGSIQDLENSLTIFWKEHCYATQEDN